SERMNMVCSDIGADSERGVLYLLTLASSMAFVYVLLFVALMLIADKTITMNAVVLPALSVFLVISVIKSVFLKEHKNSPQWLVVGSFIISSGLAVIMMIFL